MCTNMEMTSQHYDGEISRDLQLKLIDPERNVQRQGVVSDTDWCYVQKNYYSSQRRGF